MNEVEKILRKKKLEIDEIEVPEELETRLRAALKNRHSSKTIKGKWKIKVVAFLIAMMMIGYNVDTLAFYGKKLVGYDTLMSSNLKNLNELEKGQLIGKSYTFKNGEKITLDGIMLDDNQLLAFYTLQGLSENIDNVGSMSMEGIVGRHYMMGGQGEIDEKKKEVKWIMAFEPPYFFEKELRWTFTLTQGDKMEEGEIIFTLDRNKAMGHILKKEINKTIQVDESKIRFESILASPTTTVIKGTIQNIVELAKDQIIGERFRPDEIDIKLIANGKELLEQGSGMSTDMSGMKFDKEYEPLPTDLDKLQIQFVSFQADHDVHEKIKINKDEVNKSLKILGQNITINKVYEENGETYVTITTEESVLLSKVVLIIDGKKINLEETVLDEYDKRGDGRINHTRTLRFLGTGKDLQLDIHRIKYNKIYNQFIDIPMN
ncbi:DUF4179 domain-containing protein [Crassaminicella profunda]|uniref:DUF4179 domain-containing protein n=1 Tax=Crassaminicella profunda TaxID=1286698 RepID=UPI001CA60354|nr:DUF4179 domain-containing protein [Crassaminicella profunda]QZY56424.1 DUF4179 domain-containing protein [Crassaminicella profunda]